MGFTFTRVAMSGGSSSGKGFDSGKGKGGRKGPRWCGMGLLIQTCFRNRYLSSQLRIKESSPEKHLSDGMITAKRTGQNAAMVRTA